MLTIWIYSIIGVLLVSLISLIGIFALFIKKDFNNFLIYFVSFSAGALLGDVFIHLLPELVTESGFTIFISLQILAGIIFSLILEKVICWRHCHLPITKNHVHGYAVMNLVGDAVHNLIDGAIIASSFLININIGMATTMAVIFHEIPQEIGDFGVLLHAGFSKKKALLLNLSSALTAVFGCVLILVLNNHLPDISNLLIPFVSGMFIYIAAADLIPQLHKQEEISKSLWQIVAFIFGVVIMLFLKYE